MKAIGERNMDPERMLQQLKSDLESLVEVWKDQRTKDSCTISQLQYENEEIRTMITELQRENEFLNKRVDELLTERASLLIEIENLENNTPRKDKKWLRFF